ncbi:hypothetical protein SAMN04487996_12264 [Dyadobacter soli]|uniref:pEK499-p136 HEPN domain-containing protein n=1 Tax=Dyadobacter soli TaxID=659014 RepID=A0A1G7WL30_9BACT|nr:hypothetical protein [Dyadobacter soli]SDG71910.1 hypothetical protein SAMN04487996_12264 [Dyadobacter soli]
MSTTPTLTWHQKIQIEDAIETVQKLLDSKILWEGNRPIYQHAVFIELLINLKDLLIKADRLGNRIAFTDGIQENERFGIRDVTDLIGNFRDAACHNDSYRRKIGDNVSYMNKVFPFNLPVEIRDAPFDGNPNHDIGYEVGGIYLYQRKHIERAFSEIKSFFEPIIINWEP